MRGGTWQQSTCGDLRGTATRQPACHFHFEQVCKARFGPSPHEGIYLLHFPAAHIYVTCISAPLPLPAVHGEGADL